MKKIVTILVSSVILLSGSYSQTTITVNPATKYQTIAGFGGTGNLDSGYDDYLKYIVDLMGLTVMRHYVDASIVQVTNASGGDITAADINNGTMNFVGTTKYANFYKALKAKGVSTIIATCWSPPADLKMNKCNSQTVNGVCDTYCPTYNCYDANNYLIDTNYSVYGKFLTAWVKDFQVKTTLSLHALNIQNEPLFYEPYPSAFLPANTFGPCLKAVRDEFAKDSTISGIKFHGPEHMGSYVRNTGIDGVGSKYIQNLLWSPTYRNLLDIYSVHSYVDGQGYDLGNVKGWSDLDTAIRKWNKEFWMTETDFQGTADWSMCFDMSRQIYMALKHGKVNAWIYWGMMGNNGFYNFGPLPRLYAVMHFARFIRPGYQQIECNVGDADISTIAFKNPANNDVTVVMINLNTTTKKNITLNDFVNKPAYFHMYRSSVTENCAYIGKITNNSFDLPAKSVATLYFKESEPDVVWGPSAPTNPVSSNITGNSFTVSWNPSASWNLQGKPSQAVNISGYSVYLNGVKKNTSGLVTAAAFSFKTLQPATKYSVIITARDAMNNESAPVSIEVITTGSDVQAPTAPTNLKALANTATSVVLSWTAATDNLGVTSYDIYQGATKIGTVVGTSYTVTGLASGTSYTFSLKAKDAAGNISTSSNVLSISSLENQETVSAFLEIYPNPATSIIKIANPENSNADITIISITGTTVINLQNYTDQESIDVSNLVKGVYIVVLKTQNVIYKSKLIIE